MIVIEHQLGGGKEEDLGCGAYYKRSWHEPALVGHLGGVLRVWDLCLQRVVF